MIPDRLIPIYSNVCSCKSVSCIKYGEILNSPQSGSPPRGFFTESNGPVEILVVGKNPGHTLPSEAIIYSDLDGAALAIAHWNFSFATFYKKNQLSATEKLSTRFHENLVFYLSEILSVERSQVFSKVAYTNLVKCSTAADEQAKLSLFTMKECYVNHLTAEIEFFKPKMILALGREVEDFLRSRSEIKTPIFYVKHPSYSYKKSEKSGKIAQMKQAYDSATRL